MGIRVAREKSLPVLVRLAYLVNRLPRRSNRSRLGLLLDLEWVLSRLCHEASYAEFDAATHPSRVITREFLRAHLSASHSVVDVGCGTGDLLADLSSMSEHVFGVDHSAIAVQAARNRLETAGLRNVNIEVGDATDFLAALDQEVDVVVLSHILEHLEDPGGVLVAVRPHCRWVYVEVPDFDAVATNAFRVKLDRSLLFSDLDHVWEFDRAELEELLSSAGLTIAAENHRSGMLWYWCETSRRL